MINHVYALIICVFIIIANIMRIKKKKKKDTVYIIRH